MGAIIEVKYFNSFILGKTVDSDVETAVPKPVWKYSEAAKANPARNWYVEESRIRGGYNNVSVDYGAKAYLVENTNKASLLGNGIIYSGIYNSRTDVNNTNQFPVGESITRSIDPINGTVQKLYAEDTNLIIFQENKVSKALIDKDAIYSAEGSALTTSGSQVIGQVVSYAGNYGISKNPESFAFYGYRKYFVDKNRNAVLRLSRDGITEISAYGMKDFFRDNLINLDTPNFKGKAVGGFDVHSKCYVVSLQSGNENIEYKTLSFDDSINGWTSFYTYKPSFSFNLKNNFYTTNQTALYLHYAVSQASDFKNRFYNIDFDSSVEFVFNKNPSSIKNFNTINYEGSAEWKVDTIDTISDVALPINKALEWSNSSSMSLDIMQDQLFTNNFKRKEDKYFANIMNNTPVGEGSIRMGDSGSGVKGFFAKVKMSTNGSLPGSRELFAVSMNYSESSY
jgi:hypothetical protein